MKESFSKEYKKSTFSPAFIFLNSSQKKAMKAVYAFARAADDIADNPNENKKEEKLDALRQKIKACYEGEPEPGLFSDIKEAAIKYDIPQMEFQAVIDGVSMDLFGFSCENFEQLKIYMDKVAVAPGILTLRICGLGEKPQYLAENLGYAVQLTNIIRDFYQDAQNKRFYIPREEMEKFEISKEKIFDESSRKKINSLLSFQAERADFLYSKAKEVLKKGYKGSFMPSVIYCLYFSLLKKMRADNFDIINKVPKLNRLEKTEALIRSFFKVL